MPKLVLPVQKAIHILITSLLFIPFIFSHVTYTSSAFHVNLIGYDISYPQCDKPYPETPAFAIIGVNRGKAFTSNPCFEDQYSWALRNYAKPAVYMNLNFPSEKTIQYTLIGPVSCFEEDEACLAYNYGYQAASYSFNQTRNFTHKPDRWWLDVEIENTWTKDKVLNRQVIMGAIDFLTKNKQKMGIYSTSHQWSVIAGDFKPGIPVWAAGAKDKFSAHLKCTDKNAFTGGEVEMVQYIEDNFDNNHLCD